MDINKVVEAMPKISINDISRQAQLEFDIYPCAVEMIVEVQCRLLAEHGYRKGGEDGNT